MTKRETALQALRTSLAAGMPGHSVQRHGGLPLEIPAGFALVTVHDGSCEAAEVLLSPLQYEIAWLAPVTIEADTGAFRDGAAELLAARLVADPTLGGAVDWAEVGAPEAEVVALPALDTGGQQPPVFALSVPVRLHFVASSPAG